MKQLFYVHAWILLTIGVMFVIVASYYFWLMPKKQVVEAPVSEEHILGAAEFNFDHQLNESGDKAIVETSDARAELVSKFLERHHSPLTPYDYFGQVFVQLADQHQFDFRLLPAIAMQESNLCNKIPPGSYNCLGFGVHEQGTLMFDSFEANFARAAKELKKYYIDEGLTTPSQIMTKYTPSSNGSWADSVNQWMTEMRYDDRQLGREIDTDNSVLEFTQDNSVN